VHIESGVTIPAPRELVWGIAHDADLRPCWDVRVADVVFGADLAEGVDIAIGWKVPLIRAVAGGRVEVFDAPNRSVVRFETAAVPLFPPGTLTWRFDEAPEGTRMAVRFESTPDPKQPAPDWLLRMLMKRDTKRSLQNLCQLVLHMVAEPNEAPGGLLRRPDDTAA
jgi:uncharacterized protein YndB with AHSA1/START domain